MPELAVTSELSQPLWLLCVMLGNHEFKGKISYISMGWALHIAMCMAEAPPLLNCHALLMRVLRTSLCRSAAW